MISKRKRPRGSRVGRQTAVSLACITLVAMGFLPVDLGAEEPLDEASAILKAMSEYVASERNIELTFDSAIEVITPQLEKLQFTSSGGASGESAG